jgi:hypothetical protein
MERTISNCKCGKPAKQPEKVKKLRNGYFVRCSGNECPAIAQRIGKQNAIDAWNKLCED